MAEYQWETFRSKFTGRYYFRYRCNTNGRVMLQSEGYWNRGDRDRSLDRIAQTAQHAPIVEVA